MSNYTETLNTIEDYCGKIINDGDRVKSIYVKHEPENIGTAKLIDGQWWIAYDDEPDNSYKILDSNYLMLVEAL